jgi:hypothetical protein
MAPTNGLVRLKDETGRLLALGAVSDAIVSIVKVFAHIEQNTTR